MLRGHARWWARALGGGVEAECAVLTGRPQCWLARWRSPDAPEATAGAYMLRGLLTCACCDGPLACEVTRAWRSDGTRRTYRYYQCGRSKRGWARAHQRDQCPMTQVPAADMDVLAWDVIRETLYRSVIEMAGTRRAARRERR